MCGIAGIYSPQQNSALAGKLRSMLGAQQHRGPDATGVYQVAGTALALGHNRLAIHDLTASGAQPMTSANTRWVVVFNGEIYNFKDLRAQLETRHQVTFRGTSDTEVLVEALNQWGLDETLQKLDGMFAFAAWDTQARLLHLARDRMGEKPLHYGWVGNSFVFASELGALAASSDVPLPLNKRALPLFLQFSYIPTPLTVYEGILKLEPAHRLTFELRDEVRLLEKKQYWDLKSSAALLPENATESDLLSGLHDRLLKEISQQMCSDVPLGAFLSGGIDSSLIVSLMQQCSDKPIETFTIGFTDPKCNEAPYASAIAQHLGTSHTELIIGHEEAQAVIPRLPVMYGEPFADASQIPTFLVSKLAREKVTVSLSGDGGDESFGGYNRYFMAQKLLDNTGDIPILFRAALASALKLLSPAQWDSVLRAIGQGSTAEARLTGDRIHKLANILGFRTTKELYAQFVMQFVNPSDVLADKSAAGVEFFGGPFKAADSFHEMMLVDSLNYLPDGVLTKVDRATMAVSLESRAPLLSHNIVEYAWALPLDMKARNGKGKWALRQVLKQYVPESLYERPKVGFGVPLDAWLRFGLRDWAESLLTPVKLQTAGFDPQKVRLLWTEHLDGRRNWQYRLWPILMWMAWLDQHVRA